MAHEVEFRPPTRRLGKEDVVFRVSGDDGKIGELWVSKGGIEWRPAWAKKTRRMRWSAFMALMERS